MLLTMKTETEAMRAVAYVAIAHLDQARRHSDPGQRALHQARVDLLTPIVKGWCTERAQDLTSLGVQVHGGMGYVEETGAAQNRGVTDTEIVLGVGTDLSGATAIWGVATVSRSA